MAARTLLTVPQVARVLGMTESQITGFIESRQLPAEFNQGLMGYMILQDHLIEFMKSRKMFAQMQKIMMNRVLICDRDQNVTFLVRAELERSGKISVRVATTSREVEMAVQEFVPDVLAMPLAATQRATDSLAGVLRQARRDKPIRLILYHNEPEILLDAREDVKHLKQSLNVDDMVSIAGGMRKLITKIEEHFGIKRESRKLPAWQGFGNPTPPAEPNKKSTTRRRSGTRRSPPPAVPPLPPLP